MQSSVLERVLRTVPRLLVLTAPAGYLKTTTAHAYARVFKTHAAVDLGQSKNARDVLLALLQTLSPEGGDAYLRQAQLLLAAHEDVPQDLAERVLDAWREPGAPAAVVFDDADLLAPELLTLLNEILERRPAYRTCIVCTSSPLALSSGAAPAAETTAIGAADLAFTDEQVDELFADTGIAGEQLLDVIECAQGWPLLALLLRHLHTEGRLADALAHAQHYSDLKSRYEFVQKRIFESLSTAQQRVLEFCASVNDVREDDIRACLGQPGADALRSMERSFPLLLSTQDSRLDIHALLRGLASSANQHAREDLRAAARFAFRRGDPVTAARRYLACGDRDEAVKVLDAMLERGASADVASVAVLLDRATLRLHTRWFILTTFLRRYDVAPSQNLANTQAQRAQIEPDGDDMARLAIGAIEAHQLLHCGELDRMQDRLSELDRVVEQLKRGGIVSALRAHVAARFVDTLRAGLVLARGETQNAERLLKRVRFMLGQFPMINLSAVADGWLLIGLLRGDLDLVRSQCARARESLTRTGLDIVLLDLDANEAFAGWALGDDAAYRESLNRLEIRARTYRSRGFDHVLGCIGLAPECAASGLEPLRRLIIAHIFAAGRMPDEHGLAHAQRALSLARELRHALFVTFAAIAVRACGGDPAVHDGEVMKISPQTEASFLSRFLGHVLDP